jgi:hypothetical protein
VILPLQKPQYYRSRLVQQVKGVLLYGPPGTGKTMLAKVSGSSQSPSTFATLHRERLYLCLSRACQCACKRGLVAASQSCFRRDVLAPDLSSESFLHGTQSVGELPSYLQHCHPRSGSPALQDTSCSVATSRACMSVDA